MRYCIKVTRELEEPFIMHRIFADEPTRDEVLEIVIASDIHYDDNYGKIEYWEIKA